MSALPIIDEEIAETPLVMPGTPASQITGNIPEVSRLSKGSRHFRVFPAKAGFDLLPAIERAGDYCIEPNVFFSPRFCVPAMPRLDERQVRLLVLQDSDDRSSETRFLMPFTVEKPGFAIGPDLIRAWANPYGPLGTPIVERREAMQIIEDLFGTLSLPTVPLPKIIAFPDVMLNSPVVSLLRSVALSNGLPLATTRSVKRPVLDATADADVYFKESMGSHHRRDFGRLWRKMEGEGDFVFEIARNPTEIRQGMEEFLLLENAGWKGKQRTSLASDRLRAAFAREAVNSLAEVDKCRIYMLKLDNRVIASLIVFIESGSAWTWKIAYDETMRAFSPGKLLMVRTTEALLDDPNITFADSCASEDHPMMSHLWQDNAEMATLVIGVDPSKEREVRQAAAQMDLYSSTKKTAKNVSARLKHMLGKR
ncbi:GNAT family N-acetyltransferase [Ahrensia kielensis]|uniref:GNAT family N-acetyltransferase n=1 Tax=Ahrensia kielensis TaxID=76980 RepID=UPI000372B098|nr:GNAT family N-acetyltransferase [Ahrensia kielensis]